MVSTNRRSPLSFVRPNNKKRNARPGDGPLSDLTAHLASRSNRGVAPTRRRNTSVDPNIAYYNITFNDIAGDENDRRVEISLDYSCSNSLQQTWTSTLHFSISLSSLLEAGMTPGDAYVAAYNAYASLCQADKDVLVLATAVVQSSVEIFDNVRGDHVATITLVSSTAPSPATPTVAAEDTSEPDQSEWYHEFLAGLTEETLAAISEGRSSDNDATSGDQEVDWTADVFAALNLVSLG